MEHNRLSLSLAGLLMASTPLHAAEPGGDPLEVGTTLHRIDEAVVKADFEAAGFVLDAEADFLRNSEDDKSIDPFQPQTRRKTDRFVLRFRKPGA